jgi:hypothetical protein
MQKLFQNPMAGMTIGIIPTDQFFGAHKFVETNNYEVIYL